ncbi:pyridoxal phosphate-dependent aminotransferase, partial [Methanosarcinales archaeon]
MVSKRVRSVSESATMRIAGLASELQRKGVDVISFSLGEPDFITPPHICEAAKDALDAGETHYTPSAGIPELREEIALKLQRENNLQVKPSEIIVTPGAKQAIFEAVMSVVDDGDEVILFDP